MSPAVIDSAGILGAGSILDPLYHLLGLVLAWFYGLVPSYGIAIVMLTVAVRLVLFPLTAKQAKSMQAMQKVQPEIKRLQAKYKDDRPKLNEETMKFYKENKINPLSGCLPLVLQMPLFIVLYRLINDLTPHRGAKFGPGHPFAPKHVPKSSDLYAALVRSGGKMVSWGIDLARRPGSVKGIAHAWPFYALILLVMATGYYQQRQMTARTPANNANPQTQLIGKIFPAFFGVISLSIPAGVVVYFITSNIWQIGQQAWIFRQQGPPPAPEGAKPKPAKPPAKPPTKPPAKPSSRASGRKPRRGK